MFGFLAAIVVLLAVMFERIIFALSVLMIALWAYRRWLRTKAWLLHRTASLRSAVSHEWKATKRRWSMVFGRTVHVSI